MTEQHCISHIWERLFSVQSLASVGQLVDIQCHRKCKTMICVPRFDFPPLIVAVHANHWNIQNAFHGINTPSSLRGTTVS